MYCKYCGKELNDIQAICLNCGVERGKGDNFCPHCGNPTAKEAAVCLGCGAPLKKQQATKNSLGDQDKITMALLCFFLGGLGIHNFILGESKKGILKILLSCIVGIGWILALVDFIKILTDSYEIDTEGWI